MDIIFNGGADTPMQNHIGGGEDRSNIVRLVTDGTVKKTIKLDELSVSDSNNGYELQGGGNMKNQYGLSYPMIRINDVVLDRKNISGMTISCTGIIPTISLKLIFNDTSFINKNAPKDGDIVSTYMRTTSKNVEYVRNDFVITSFNSTMNGGSCTASIFGKLFIPEFDSQMRTDVYTGSSKSVMRSVAMRYGLGFSFNDFDDTNDYQKWYRCNESCEKFISNIVPHIWKNNTSFFKVWVDMYYNLCFVNVNKFMLSSENKEEVDITFSSNVTNAFNLLNTENIDSEKISVKILTNDTNMKGLPFYIKKWKPINNSTSISFSTGYNIYTYGFNHNQNTINDESEKCFSYLECTPSYDMNKIDTRMIMRGRSKYDKRLNPENELERVNYDYINTYNKTAWTGINYVMSDADKNNDQKNWSGNVHKNYGNAPYHNAINSNEMNKMYIEVECEGLNLQVMRGERVPVYLVYDNIFDMNVNKNLTGNDVDSRCIRLYSGYYYIDSIEYKYKPLTESMSPFTTAMTLKRREWPTPEAI